MKFLKSSLATIAAIALIAPAAAQYGKDDIADKELNGGIFQTIKLLLTGGPPASLFEADPNGVIFNITDANYRDTLFQDEWIVTL